MLLKSVNPIELYNVVNPISLQRKYENIIKNNNIQIIPFLSKDPDARTGIFGNSLPLVGHFWGQGSPSATAKRPDLDPKNRSSLREVVVITQ